MMMRQFQVFKQTVHLQNVFLYIRLYLYQACAIYLLTQPMVMWRFYLFTQTRCLQNDFFTIIFYYCINIFCYIYSPPARRGVNNEKREYWKTGRIYPRNTTNFSHAFADNLRFACTTDERYCGHLNFNQMNLFTVEPTRLKE